MLLSDRDILAAQADGHISLDPWTPEMVQPASIDVRLDRFFRLFNNHAYTYVDPAENQGELTEQFEVKSDEPWTPAVRASSRSAPQWEYVKLDATIAARLEGKARSVASASSPTPPAASSTRLRRPYHAGAVQCVDVAGEAVAGHEDRPDVLLPAELARRASVRFRRYRLALPGPAWPDPEPLLRELLQGRYH